MADMLSTIGCKSFLFFFFLSFLLFLLFLLVLLFILSLLRHGYAVAVVVAFFACWAPFHAQRLMATFIHSWSPLTLAIHSGLFHVSGRVVCNGVMKVGVIGWYVGEHGV